MVHADKRSATILKVFQYCIGLSTEGPAKLDPGYLIQSCNFTTFAIEDQIRQSNAQSGPNCQLFRFRAYQCYDMKSHLRWVQVRTWSSLAPISIVTKTRLNQPITGKLVIQRPGLFGFLIEMDLHWPGGNWVKPTSFLENWQTGQVGNQVGLGSIKFESSILR